MIDEGAEQREEELAERDRIGEKSPSASAAFGSNVTYVDPEWERRVFDFVTAHERPPLSPAPPPGVFQMPAPVPRPRRHTLREELAAAMAYLRRRR